MAQLSLDEQGAAIGRALAEQRLGDALDGIRALPADIRGQFGVAAQEADLLGRLGRPLEELELLERLVEQNPDNPSLWVSVGYGLKSLGRIDEAVASARRAIAIAPGYGRPWWLLSDIKGFRFDDDDIATMERLAAEAVTPPDEAALHFALGSALDRSGDHARAFAHYGEGNAIRSSAFDPRTMAISPKVDRAIDVMTPELMAARRGSGHPSNAPIFVIGVQRSGTSLIEQILASHSAIEGVSELPVLPQLVREIADNPALDGSDPFAKLAAMSDADRIALGETYLDRARPFRQTDKPHFVDKQPANWSNLLAIRLIFSNATVIDARRHPMAVGWSNFQQNYDTGMRPAFGLAAMGTYYRDYLRMMEHADTVDPGAVHHVVNERLVEDPEGQIGAMIAATGLALEPAMLDFHNTDRAVRTPSADQVKRPLNRDGFDRWRSYDPWLGELRDALGDALDRWDKNR